MENKPLISIIIPTFNRAKVIGETLDSILAQTYTNWECIIVDDASNDNTLEALQFYLKDKRFQYYKRPESLLKGPNSCRNYGFDQCKGDIVNWFDSDDIYQPNALSEVVLEFKATIDAVVVKVERFNNETGETVDYNKIVSNQPIEDYLTGKITYYVCGPFWNKSFLDKQKQLFDINIRNLDDWDFNLRLLYQNPNIIYIDKALIRYRKFHSSLSKALVHHNNDEIQSAFYAREKHVKLLRNSNHPALKNFNKFIINQYKKHLKALFYSKDNFSKTILKKLVLKQWSEMYIFSGFKSLFIGLFYLVFKKGSFLLKKL